MCVTVSHAFFDRDRRIDAVVIEKIDPIGPEPGERRVGHFPNVLGRLSSPACLPAALELEAGLGRNF
jgi:hypothetical protein